MEVSRYRIDSTDIDDFVDYLIDELSFNYESHSPNMSLLASEEYYFRNGSTQLNMIVAKSLDNAIVVDVVGAAGGRTIFRFDWGSEIGYIERVAKKLRTYAKDRDVKIEELKMRGTRQPRNNTQANG